MKSGAATQTYAALVLSSVVSRGGIGGYLLASMFGGLKRYRS